MRVLTAILLGFLPAGLGLKCSVVGAREQVRFAAARRVHAVAVAQSSTPNSGSSGSAQFSIRTAEPGFVDGDNLEEGETLLHALKAFEPTPIAGASAGRLLAAGALVEDVLGGVTIWLGDSLERGVGPNMQVAAALELVDRLVLFYLRGAGLEQARRGLMAYAPSGTASRLALRQRGFVEQALSDTATEDLLFRMCPTAAAAEYARFTSAVGGSILADEISSRLSSLAPSEPRVVSDGVDE